MIMLLFTACGKKEYVKIMDQGDVYDTYDEYIREELNILYGIYGEKGTDVVIKDIEVEFQLAPEVSAGGFVIDILYSTIDRFDNSEINWARIDTFGDEVQFDYMPNSSMFGEWWWTPTVERIKEGTIREEYDSDSVKEFDIEKLADDYYKLSYISESGLYDGEADGYYAFTYYLYSDEEAETYQSYYDSLWNTGMGQAEYINEPE